MRVYEIANEIDQPVQDVITLINESFHEDVSSHMSTIDEETADKVREAYTRAELEQSLDVPTPRDTNTLKNIYGKTLDSVAFGIGLGLLLSPNHGDETRQNIREEIRDLGKEVTDPIKIGGEEIIDLLAFLPSQLSALSNQALDNSLNQVEQLGPIVQGVVNEASDLINTSTISMLSTNGESSKEPQDTFQ